MYLKTVIVEVILIFLSSVNGEFSDDIKLCKFGDLECIKETINFLFKNKIQGLDSINLTALNPLKYDKVLIQMGPPGAASMNLTLRNQSVFGLETAKFLRVKGFGKDLTKKHSLHFQTDYLTTVGDYDVTGKILILPIIGSGKMNITFVDCNMYLSFMGKPVEKDSATYLTNEDVRFDIEVEKIFYKFDNLFNGDKALGDNMNLFLNNNGRDIYQEAYVSLSSEIGRIFNNVIKDVFLKYPYDKYFTD